MHRLLLIGFASILALGWLDAGQVAAQGLTPEELQRQSDEWGARKVMHRTVALGLLVGAGGNATLPGASVALERTYGVNIRYEHPLTRYVVLGSNLEIQSWTTTPWSRISAVGHNTLLDLAVLAKLRYPIPNKAELYLAVPVGAMIDAGDNAAFGGRTRTGVGYSLAGLLGARLFLSPTLGLWTELGAIYHSFQHVVVPTGAARYRIPMELLQPEIVIGLFYRI